MMRSIQATSSGELSANAQIMSTGGYLHGFELNPPVSGIATLKLYDSNNSTTAGKLLLATATVASGMNSVYCEFPGLRTANVGIYAVLGGTSTTYSVGFSLG